MTNLGATRETLSIGVYDARRRREVLHPLIPKGASLPAVVEDRFFSPGDGETNFGLNFYRGEGTEIRSNLVTLIGILQIGPFEYQQPAPFRIRLEIDLDGFLTARITDEDVGKVYLACFDYQNKQDTNLVFISAKSEDYNHARRVFQMLNERGVPAFLAETSLPDQGDSDYRKTIDDALDRANHMVVVTSSRANVTSSWVEAEWGLFINEKRSGRKMGNIVTVVVPGMHPGDLPASLRYYEIILLGAEGLEKLLRYVK